MKILVATPIAGWGGISYSYPISLLSIVDELKKAGHEVKTKFVVGGYPIDVVRNMIAEELIKNKYDYLLSLDADISLANPNIVNIAVSLNLPIVTGVYMLRSGDSTSLAIFKNKLIPLGVSDLKESLMKVSASGMGCVLIAREVFEKIERPWFKWTYDPSTRKGMGEDRYFFIKARKYGIPTIAFTHWRCTHTVLKDLEVK
jgi:hypothetical protein